MSDRARKKHGDVQQEGDEINQDKSSEATETTPLLQNRNKDKKKGCMRLMSCCIPCCCKKDENQATSNEEIQIATGTSTSTQSHTQSRNDGLVTASDSPTSDTERLDGSVASCDNTFSVGTSAASHTTEPPYGAAKYYREAEKLACHVKSSACQEFTNQEHFYEKGRETSVAGNLKKGARECLNSSTKPDMCSRNMETGVNPLRRYLGSLANKIGKNDLDIILFHAEGLNHRPIHKREREDIKDSFSLFTILQEVGHIDENQCSVLVQLLNAAYLDTLAIEVKVRYEIGFHKDISDSDLKEIVNMNCRKPQQAKGRTAQFSAEQDSSLSEKLIPCKICQRHVKEREKELEKKYAKAKLESKRSLQRALQERKDAEAVVKQLEKTLGSEVHEKNTLEQQIRSKEKVHKQLAQTCSNLESDLKQVQDNLYLAIQEKESIEKQLEKAKKEVERVTHVHQKEKEKEKMEKAKVLDLQNENEKIKIVHNELEEDFKQVKGKLDKVRQEKTILEQRLTNTGKEQACIQDLYKEAQEKIEKFIAKETSTSKVEEEPIVGTKCIGEKSRIADHPSIPLCYPDNFEWDYKKGQLVRIKKVKRSSRLKLCDEAVAMLKKIKTPVCIVAIAGDRRTGKSYLISQLNEPRSDKPIFNVSAKMKANTVGIWINTTTFERTVNGTKMSVLLLDTEGLDSTDSMGEGDDPIFTLTVLLSSIMIYNSQSVPKAGDLQKLRICIGELAKRIHVHAGDSRSSGNEFYKFFPKFIWLFRDVLLTPTITIEKPDESDDEEQEVEMKEYILTEVFKKINHGTETVQSGIGDAILRYFPTFECFSLPQPSFDSAVLKDLSNEKNRKKICESFLDGIEVFRRKVYEMMEPKSSWQQMSTINGWQFTALVEGYVNALNQRGSLPNMESTWQQVVKLQLQDSQQKAVAKYLNTMDVQVKTYPIETYVLMKEHRKANSTAMEMFQDGVKNIVDADVVDRFRRELQETIVKWDNNTVCGGQLMLYIEKNNIRSKELCTEIADELVKNHIFSLKQGDIHKFSIIEERMNDVNLSYQHRARGPMKMKILENILYKQINNFYMTHIRWLCKLDGFKTPEMAEEEKRRLEEQIRSTQELDKVKEQCDNLQQMMADTKAHKDSLEKTMDVERTKHEQAIQSIREKLEKPLENFKYEKELKIKNMKEQHEIHLKETMEKKEESERKSKTRIKQYKRKFEELQGASEEKIKEYEEKLKDLKLQEENGKEMGILLFLGFAVRLENPSYYVTFEDNQAYPEYIITFNK